MVSKTLKIRGCWIIAFIGFSHLSYADVLSPSAVNLRERASKHPQLVDRADQYCTNKKIADVCTIPGDHFSGGGNGKCERVLNDKAEMLDLYCEIQETLVIDRKLPTGGYQADADICNDPQLTEAVCGQPPLIADQFCEGKKAHDACVVSGELRILFKPSTNQRYQGQCQIQTESKHRYFRGHITLSRPVLMCSPLQPVPERSYQPISLLQRLKQSFTQ